MNENKRIIKLKDRMKDYADYALISPGSNLYYLTGLDPIGTMERLFFLIVPLDSSSFILAPKLYENELKDTSMELKIWDDNDDPYLLLKKELDVNNETVLAVEDSLPVGIFLQLKKIFVSREFKSINPILSDLRIIKDDSELEFIQRSATIADNVFIETLKHKLFGMSEIEIAELITELIKEKGGEGVSFDPIVASGPNGANPHHMPTTKKIEKGELVVLDFGARYRHYSSDITRTIGIENLDKASKEVYDTVLGAQENAFQKVRRGISARDIDFEARIYIESKNFGRYFTHRTGHGLGLDVHELPYISSTSYTSLQDNMVFTIEPGIYIPGKFGVRIEDDVCINQKGKRLTQARRDLIVI